MTDLQAQPAREPVIANRTHPFAPVVAANTAAAVTSSERRHAIARASVSKIPLGTRGSTVYCHRGTRHTGHWDVSGLTMTLSCDFGTFRISVGQGNPQKVARNLLKSICRRLALKNAAESGAADASE